MKLAIMQPYFMPYIGYFQLINAVDKFVVYDNIKYTKKGWINRNRILVDGTDKLITLPLKKDSDFLNVSDRYLIENYSNELNGLFNKICKFYQKAPFFNQAIKVIEECLHYDSDNLFDFIFFSIKKLCEYMEINTEIIVSSTINIDHNLKSKEKVIALTQCLNADTYVNPIGGLGLYDKQEFKARGIDLYFLRSEEINYKQFNHEFVPWLSIIDVMMFNDQIGIKCLLNKYKII